MKKLLVALSFIFLLISSSFAQTGNSYKATLKKMLELAGTEETFKMAINQMIDIFKQQYKEVPESVWVDFGKEFTKTSLTDLVDLLSPVYAKYLTESDLQKIIEFYQSPVGKKYAEKTPAIMQESMLVGEEWGKKVGQKFLDKLKEKGY